MRVRAIATVLGCFLTVVASARQAGATPVLTTDPGDLLGGTLIDFEDLLQNPITDFYTPQGVTFSGGLHAELGTPVPGWGAISATNQVGVNGTPVTMTFSTPLKALGFEIVTMNGSVDTLDIFTQLAGVQTFVGTVALHTNFEKTFFGILANPGDLNPFFDSVILTTLTGAPDNLTPFVIDNLQFQAVPEPASMTLLGAGAMGLIARARRARRNSANRAA